jgi:hypothetical protein
MSNVEHTGNREFKFAFHIPARKATETSPATDDAHIVKYIEHNDDGTQEPKLMLLKNYKRPFWITKKFYRNHTQRKEAEDLDKLDKFYTTESELGNSICKALKKPKFKNVSKYDVRQMKESIYVYGSDIASVSMLHHEFKEKCDIITPYKVGILDIENSTDGEDRISLISYVHGFEDRIRVYLYANKQELPIVYNFEKKVEEVLKRGLPDKLPDGIDFDKIDIEIKMYDTEIDTITNMMNIVHRSNIDILSGWGFLHDVSVIAKRAEVFGVEPKVLFSDESIPYDYKHFKIIKGRTTMMKQDGSSPSIPFEEIWNTFESSASFIMIDSMALYNFIRSQDPKIQGGYGLDNVLKKSINIGKLKVDSIEGVTQQVWHNRMRKEKPVEYGAYAIWDSLGLYAKNLKDHDLDFTLPLLSGISPFSSFNSNPSKIYDDFFLFYLQEKKILCSFGNTGEFETLNRRHWTVTLNLWKIDSDYSIPIFGEEFTKDVMMSSYNDELTLLRKLGYAFEDRIFDSRFFVLNFDLDVTSAYPTAILVLNVSTDTVTREVIRIEGVEKETMKILNIELMTGVIGHIKYGCEMHGLPDTFELEELIKGQL